MLFALLMFFAGLGTGLLIAVLPDHLAIRKSRKARETRAHWEQKLLEEGWTRGWMA